MNNGILIRPRAEADAGAVAALAGLAASVICDVTGRVAGANGLRPVNRSPVSACGNAFTVRVRAGDNLLIHKALEMLAPGDVLVVDGEGDLSRALVGEIMMHRGRTRGAIAFVIDGAVRDVDAFEAAGFPCWARGVNLRGPYKDGPGTINQPVSIGGMLVRPGDVVVGDSDGVVAIAATDALDIGRLAREKAAAEQATIAQILDGSYSSSWIDTALAQRGA